METQDGNILFLYPENRAFVEKSSPNLINEDAIKSSIASQHHMLRPYGNSMLARVSLGVIGIITFIVFFYLSIQFWGSIFSRELSLSFAAALNILVALFVSVGAFTGGYVIITSLRYNPDTVNRLYDEFLESASLHTATISRTFTSRGYYIEYIFQADGEAMKQEYHLTEVRLTLEEFHALQGKTIYVLYSQEKLAFPL